MNMLHRLVHLTLVGAALFLFADGADARGRRGGGGCGGGGCGGGGFYGGGCGGGGCGGGGFYGGGCGGGSCGMGGFVGGGGCPGGICFLPGGAPPAGGGGGKTNGGMKKNGGDEGTIAQPANIVVNLPADAKLYVDGHQTRSISGQRLLTTPNLRPGRDYHYTLRAEVTRGGEVQRVSQRVAVRAGQETRVNIEIPTTVAAR
jgi:uncharacterized protein (TIGR03000 family)